MNRDVWQKYALELSQLQTKPIIDGSFWPTNYPLIVWYRADDVVIDSGAVSQWNDLSGNDYHALQATAAYRPTQVMDALGGEPVLRFDGTDDFLQTAAFGVAYSHPNTFFVVYRIAGTGSTADCQHVFDNLGTDWDGWTKAHCLYFWNGLTEKGMYMSSGGYLYYAQAPVWPFDYRINTCVFNTTTSALYGNGVLNVSGNSGTHTLTGLNIGRHYRSGADTRFLNGDIAEIIAVDGTVTDADHNLFLQYFTARYGIATTPV